MLVCLCVNNPLVLTGYVDILVHTCNDKDRLEPIKQHVHKSCTDVTLCSPASTGDSFISSGFAVYPQYLHTASLTRSLTNLLL